MNEHNEGGEPLEAVAVDTPSPAEQAALEANPPPTNHHSERAAVPREHYEVRPPDEAGNTNGESLPVQDTQLTKRVVMQPLGALGVGGDVKAKQRAEDESSGEPVSGSENTEDTSAPEASAADSGGAARPPESPPSGGGGNGGDHHPDEDPEDEDPEGKRLAEGELVGERLPEHFKGKMERFRDTYDGRAPQSLEEIPKEETVEGFRAAIREFTRRGGTVMQLNDPDNPRLLGGHDAYGPNDDEPRDPYMHLQFDEPQEGTGRGVPAYPSTESMRMGSIGPNDNWSVTYDTGEGAPVKSVGFGSPPTYESSYTPTDRELEEATGLLQEAFADAPHKENPQSVIGLRSLPPVERIRVVEHSPTTREKIDRNREVLGRAAEAVVVVDNDAIDAALGETTVSPHTTQVTTTTEAFSSLREQGWEQSYAQDGTPILTRDDVAVVPNWGTIPVDGVRTRAWRTESGLLVAHPSDIYASLLDGGTEEERAAAARIRERLQDPNRPPLEDRVMWRELAEARENTPPHLRGRWDAAVAEKVAANGDFITRTLCGDARTGRVNQLVGPVDLIEHNVPATYHEASKHSPEGIREMHRHFDTVNAADRAAGREPTFTAEDYIDIASIEKGSDAIFGGVRRGYGSKGHDESRSAALVQSHLLYFGYPEQRAARVARVIYGSTFDEHSGTQLGTDHYDPLVRAGTGHDLQPLNDPWGPRQTSDLLVEDGCSTRHPNSLRTLGRVANEAGVRIINTMQGMELIDMSPNARPNDGYPAPLTVVQMASNRYRDSGNFHLKYRFPFDYTLVHQGIREDNAKILFEIADRLVTTSPARRITAVQSVEMTEEHARRMEIKWGAR